jgi:ABC-type multidrug transport system ATPase subunit
MKIEIKNLTKVYGEKTSAVLALSELDLMISENEICIVRGPNGSGKTTLISILAGELTPTVGEIRLVSEQVKEPVISVINQFNNLIEDLSIEEHFKLLNRETNLALVDQKLLLKMPSQISRGEAQLISIALALSPDTDLLLADEPSGALGADDAKLVYEFIRTAAVKNNCAVILVTHDVAAEEIADRVVRLRDGRISETWKPGNSVKQVINSKGWVRIPDEVSPGLTKEVEIQNSAIGAVINGHLDQAPKFESGFNARKPGINKLIKVVNVSTFYGSTPVSSDLSFQITEGELFCIYGKSGIGKTTLLKTLCGLHKGFSGDLEISKTPTIPYFNIDLPYGMELNLFELNVEPGLIEKLQLENFAHRQIKTYSGGQRQRALVAMALSNSADVIALDEPTSALDNDMTDLVIKNLLESTKTLILATHDERLLQVANTNVLL